MIPVTACRTILKLEEIPNTNSFFPWKIVEHMLNTILIVTLCRFVVHFLVYENSKQYGKPTGMVGGKQREKGRQADEIQEH